ncbi:hypothetical protein C0995_004296, partial [Termitomyces sp. Mi166
PDATTLSLALPPRSPPPIHMRIHLSPPVLRAEHKSARREVRRKTERGPDVWFDLGSPDFPSEEGQGQLELDAAKRERDTYTPVARSTDEGEGVGEVGCAAMREEGLEGEDDDAQERMGFVYAGVAHGDHDYG